MEKPKLIKDLGRMYATLNSKQKQRFGIYECPKCKQPFKTNSGNVNFGAVSQCRKCYAKAQIIHGYSKHRLKRVYQGMKQRCYNPKSTSYPDYGDRGITVCDEWNSSFVVFIEWAIDNGYSDNLSIDRINVNGNYEPSNCRWATDECQHRNTRLLRSTNKSGFRGVSKYRKYWRTRILIEGKEKVLKYSKCRLECAYAYDKYVLDNNLEHPTNLLFRTAAEN